jgi:CBS-domain-containing membrane protein
MAQPSYERRLPSASGVRLRPELVATLPPVAQRTSVAQAMEKVSFQVGPDMDLIELVSLFTDMGAHAVPVVDARGQPIGVISKTDVLSELYERRVATRLSSGVHAAVPPKAPPGDTNRPSRTGDVMTPLSIVVTEETPLAKAIALIAYKQVHPLPVLDDQGQVAGILSSMDVLRWLARNDGQQDPGRG